LTILRYHLTIDNRRCDTKTILIVPDSPSRKAAGVRQRSRLTWETNHPSSTFGLGVLLYHNDDVLDGARFRVLRDTLGARILTTDPMRVCRALDLPEGEEGIEKV
jgi:hypothetical protein